MKNRLVATKMVVYQAKNGAIELRGDFARDTIWGSLQQIADLFETDKSGISRHIKNIYITGELDRAATVAKFATVQKEGDRTVKREVEYYDYKISTLRTSGAVPEKRRGVQKAGVDNSVFSYVIELSIISLLLTNICIISPCVYLFERLPRISFYGSPPS
jgi:hypothetical protein